MPSNPANCQHPSWTCYPVLPKWSRQWCGGEADNYIVVLRLCNHCQEWLK